MPDMNGVLSRVLEGGDHLATTDSGSSSGAPPRPMDENGVWDAVYDRATNTVRVVYV